MSLEEIDMPPDRPIQIERDFARALEAKQRFGSELLARGGVHTVGIGLKRRGGSDTDEVAVVVLVSRKLPAQAVGGQFIPPRLVFYSTHDAEEVVVLTDVREVSPPTPLAHVDADLNAKVRPVPGGYGISVAGFVGGTLGGWVWDDETDSIVLISNKHVIQETAGALVYQPAGGAYGDVFASVLRASKVWDASVAKPLNSSYATTHIVGGGGAVYEVADPSLQMLVEKTGKTTKHTLGRITVIHATSLKSTDDILVEPDPGGTDFVQPGDSGSLLVERNHPQGHPWKRVVGLVWGGSGTDKGNWAWVHPIKPIFQELGLRPVCAGMFNKLFGASDGSATGPGSGKGGGKGTGGGGLDQTGQSFGRHLERRFASTPVGSIIAAALSDHRDAATEILLDLDGYRAFDAFIAPFLEESVTTDDVLARTIRDEDVRNAERLLVVVERLRPDMRAVVEQARSLARRAAGRSVGTLLGDEDALATPSSGVPPGRNP
jgi:hypothetical protein